MRRIPRRGARGGVGGRPGAGGGRAGTGAGGGGLPAGDLRPGAEGRQAHRPDPECVPPRGHRVHPRASRGAQLWGTNGRGAGRQPLRDGCAEATGRGGGACGDGSGIATGLGGVCGSPWAAARRYRIRDWTGPVLGSASLSFGSAVPRYETGRFGHHDRTATRTVPMCYLSGVRLVTVRRGYRPGDRRLPAGSRGLGE